MFKLVVTPGGYVEGDNTLVDVHDEEGFYGHLSVNLPEQAPEGLFWLKDWSENRDMAEALIADGTIAIDSRVSPVMSGYVAVKAARVL
jgi:hypothetical protein